MFLHCGEATTNIAESSQPIVTQMEMPSPSPSAWNKNRLKKDVGYYDRMKEEYHEYIKRNELLTIWEALNLVTTRTISFLMVDVKTRKLIGVSREAIEEALKYFKIPKDFGKMIKCYLGHTSLEEEAKNLAGIILITNSLWLQTEYIGTRQSRITFAWSTHGYK